MIERIGVWSASLPFNEAVLIWHLAPIDFFIIRGDRSTDYSLNPEKHNLALENIETLATTESPELALGDKRAKGQS